jgi:hypothetical protein
LDCRDQRSIDLDGVDVRALAGRAVLIWTDHSAHWGAGVPARSPCAPSRRSPIRRPTIIPDRCVARGSVPSVSTPVSSWSNLRRDRGGGIGHRRRRRVRRSD